MQHNALFVYAIVPNIGVDRGLFLFTSIVAMPIHVDIATMDIILGTM